MEPVAPAGARTAPLDPRFAYPAWRGAAAPARPKTTQVTVATRRGSRTITVEGNATWSALNAAIAAFDEGAPETVIARTRTGALIFDPEVARARAGGHAPGVATPEDPEGTGVPEPGLPAAGGEEPIHAGGTKSFRGARVRFLRRSVQMLGEKRNRLWVTHEKMFRWFNGLSMALQGAKDALRRASMVKGADPGLIARLSDKVKSLETQLANLERDMTDVASQIGALTSLIDGMTAEIAILEG